MANVFYFAWVNSGTAFNPAVHNVEDEKVFSFNIEQSEGDFASLSLSIKNPQIGLLTATRKTWAWLSWFDGTEIVPLFFGRLVGIPENINQEIVTLVFTARPVDYNAQKLALAATLQVVPYYDPIWIDAAVENDPDTVLEAYAALWHIDRTSHVLTVSDILTGEDGTEAFTESEVPYSSVEIRLNQPPLRSVSVDGVVNWTQAAAGTIDVVGGAGIYGQPETISTYTGDGLISGWPTKGARIGGGWTVGLSKAVDVDNVAGVADNAFGGLLELAYPSSWIFIKTLDWTFVVTSLIQGVLIPLWRVKLSMQATYDVQRQKTEHARFTLNAHVQSIVTLPGEDEVLTLNLTSRDVGAPLVPLDFDTVPIVDVRRRSYFQTDRGIQSLEYLVLLARSHLLLRSRAVEISFQCLFVRAVDLSLRKSATLTDYRLPGGTATGKVIKYSISCDGRSGLMSGHVTMGCAIGYGETIDPVEGTPDYVEFGYVDPGYQTFSGTLVTLPVGDVGYSIPGGDPLDDGLNLIGLAPGDVVLTTIVHNPASIQLPLIVGNVTGIDSNAVATAAQNYLKTISTTLEIHMKPIEGGPFETAYDITVSTLAIPKMIDLEAA